MAVGTIRLFSSALGMCVTCDVILPQRDPEASQAPLPVLWLLHGAHGCHNDWIRKTNIERYVAPYNLAVVMPSAQNSCYVNMAHGLNYYSYIAEELPQAMRTHFRFSDRREDNFIAGLSMGGRGSFIIGMNKPEQYAAIGCLSAGAVHERSALHALPFGDEPIEGTYKDPFGNAKRILKDNLPRPRIFHACGQDDFLLDSARQTRDFFSSIPDNPFDYQYIEAPGAHTWDFWDAHIQEFIRFLNLPDARK
ncbi:MAG: esterase family protein [Clostridiales bacterium]|nr:esterase family protein [Clostridiales bacterium]